MRKANCKIAKTIKTLEDDCSVNNIQESVEKISEKKLISEYKLSLSIKDKLEEKAKNNSVAVTISITLMMGASGIVSNAIENQSIHFSIITTLLFVAAVMYMITAGILALKMLGEENRITTFMEDEEDIKNCPELKAECYTAKTLNNMRNLKRNNYINTSYGCIRNALICLSILTIFSLLSLYVTQPFLHF
jgi:hypothetical protein